METTSSFHQSIFVGVLFVFLPHLSCMLQAPVTPPSSTGSDELLPPPEPKADPSGPTHAEPDPSAHTQAAKPTRSDPGKVPKWLKLPGEDGTGC